MTLKSLTKTSDWKHGPYMTTEPGRVLGNADRFSRNLSPRNYCTRITQNLHLESDHLLCGHPRDRITRLTHPPVCLSVCLPYGLVTRKQEIRIEKPKLA